MRIAIAAVALLAVAADAAAFATIKVGPNEAITDIATAAAAAVDGDTILIQKGTYVLPATVNFPQNNLTITGKSAIVDGATLGGNDNDVDCFNLTGVNVLVQGVTFRNGSDGIQSSGGTLTVTKCTFNDCSGNGINITAGATATITKCTFYGVNTRAVVAVANGVTVSKCTVRSNGSDGIHITGDDGIVESNTLKFVDDNIGIRVRGDDASVRKNKLTNVGGIGIELTDDDAVVEASTQVVDGNTLTMIESSTGIAVSHTIGLNSSALVQKNKVTDVGSGISVVTGNAHVLSNKVTGIHGGTGVLVESDAMEVTGNTVASGADDSDGFELDSGSGTGGGTISKNTAKDMIDAGFYLGDNNGLFNVDVSKCTATNCGAEDEAGFFIVGDGNEFVSLKATGIDSCGIELDSGTGNTFTKCTVSKINGDGFRVNGGSSNDFINCSASSCAADGFDNRGTGTELQGGKFRGSRFDVTNDFGGGATFTDMTLGSVNYGTGGSAQQSESD